MDLRLTSAAFSSGEDIPTKYTCEGTNVSPPLSWSGVSDEVKSLVLIVDDPDASDPGHAPFAQWVVYNISPAETGFAEGYSSENHDVPGTQGRNSFGTVDYIGPCPPLNSTHAYYFRLYALSEILEIPQGANRSQVMEAMEDYVLGHTELIGRFSRSAAAQGPRPGAQSPTHRYGREGKGTAGGSGTPGSPTE